MYLFFTRSYRSRLLVHGRMSTLKKNLVNRRRTSAARAPMLRARAEVPVYMYTNRRQLREFKQPLGKAPPHLSTASLDKLGASFADLEVPFSRPIRWIFMCALHPIPGYVYNGILRFIYAGKKCTRECLRLTGSGYATPE